mgnify:CR=1 FL=1
MIVLAHSMQQISFTTNSFKYLCWKLFDLRTRITARGNLTGYFAIVIGLSEISRSIYIDQNHFLTIIHHVTVMLVRGRSEGKFPVEISVKELDVNEIYCNK